MKLTLAQHGDTVAVGLRSGYSYREIGRLLGCDQGTVSKFVREHFPDDVRPPNCGETGGRPAPAADPTEPPDQLAMAKAEIAELKKANRTFSQQRVIGERLLEEIRSITPAAAPTYDAPRRAEGDGKHHTHVLLLSDLHVGEVVNKVAMNGLGEYNFEILQARMSNIQAALTSFQNSRSYPIEELRIWCLGDIVGGAHHQELDQTNEFPVAKQAWESGLLLGRFIETLVPDYLRIHAVYIDGNHARMNQKPQSKQTFNSFDWLAGQTAELYLAQYPTVTHNNPLSGYVIDKVAGKTVLLGHGDGIRSTMPGVPWGGIMRRFNELYKTYARIGERLDYFALGHFHQANVVKGIFMNGSVKGPDEYVLKQFGTADPPEQLLLTFCTETERLTDVSYINP